MSGESVLPVENADGPAEPDAAGGPGGLWSRSFAGLLVAQFFGALNDNMFRWLVVPIGKRVIEENYGPQYMGVALAGGLACFVAPFVVLAAPAGYLADRFDKRAIIVGCKLAEVVIMVLGMAAILTGNIFLMFAVVALMGTQSALFGPSKFGSIPEIVREDRIASANGLIGMTTVLAIMIGSFAGGVLYVWTTPTTAGGELLARPGHHQWWIAAAALVGVAAAGFSASLMIRRLEIANPTRTFPFNIPRQTVRDLILLGSRRPLLRAALGCAAFWCLGALAQMNVDLFVINELGGRQLDVGVLLVVLAFGVGTGSVLAGLWSAGRVELGIVSLGAAGIVVSSLLLFAVPQPTGDAYLPVYLWSCLWLFMLGGSAGLYVIPIQAFLQHRAPAESRGSILAASGFLTFLGMLMASVLFGLWQTVMGLSARQIFLTLGIMTVPVLLYVVWLMPGSSARCLVWLLSHTIYRVKIEGRKNLPREGGAVLVANHVSMLDGVLLILFSPRPIRMVARADPKQSRLFWWLAKDLGTIPIQPGKRSVVESIRTARDAVADGDLVCIFPEGHITQTGQMGEFRPGFLAILKDTGAPVVPIHLGGLWGSIFSYKGGKPLRKFPRRWPYPVWVTIGQPIYRPVDAAEVRQAVAKLGGNDGREDV